jgi:Ca2+-binding RTX toxin-like protein
LDVYEDSTTPLITSMVASGNTITLAFSEQLKSTSLVANHFKLALNTGAAIAASTIKFNSAANTITLGFNATRISNTAATKITYSPSIGVAGLVTDLAGNPLSAFTNKVVDTYRSSTSVSVLGDGANSLQASSFTNLQLIGTSAIKGNGNAFNNTITGNSAANTLDGGAGNDTLLGGEGNDTYVVDSIEDTIIEDAEAGSDLVKASVSWTLGANLEKLTLIGADDLAGTGNELNNVITGNSGNNAIDGGSGSDILMGGKGDDLYRVDTAYDTIIESSNEGTDTVNSSVSWILGANFENLNLMGSANLLGTGNRLNNVITGNGGNNVIDGGAGNDLLIGGQGDDIYFVDSTLDSILESSDEGIDTVNASATWTLANNLENLNLIGSSNLSGDGNATDNIIVGNSGNNRLDGGSGNDKLIGGFGDDTLIGGNGNDILEGGSGNDTYYIDSETDTIAEYSGQGIDTVTSAISTELGANLEKLSLSGINAINGIGNSLNNTIVGNNANNLIDGLAGTDILTGAAGADIFRFTSKTIFGLSTCDHITDFSSTQGDSIAVGGALFGQLSTTSFKPNTSLATANNASALTTALASNSAFVYDSRNGNLYWNQNGSASGFGSGGIFAVLDNGADLSSITLL